MYQPIFFSGPHGGGKSTLVEKLRTLEIFVENDFDIDFTTDFPNLNSLSSFERSLIRLYHRHFIAQYAHALARKYPDKCVLTNRTVYDSEAYIFAYHQLGWITEQEFEKLDFVIKRFLLRPYAIVLNPPLEVIKSRLLKRKTEATRTNRDVIFEKEDAEEFIELLWKYFKTLQNDLRILYIEDNDDEDIEKIVSWASKLNR